MFFLNNKKTKKNEKTIERIQEKTGWSRRKIIKELSNAEKQYGATPRLFNRFNVHEIPENEREGYYRSRFRRYNYRENIISEISELASIDKEDLRKQLKEAKDKYGLSIGLFKKSEFWKVPEEEKEKVAKEAIRKREEERKIEEFNDQIANNRKNFVISKLNKQQKKSIDETTNPETIQVATTILESGDNKVSNKEKNSFEYIQKILGNKLLPNDEYHEKKYAKFKKVFKELEIYNQSKDKLGLYFIDWILFAHDFGFDQSDYLEYQFYKKDIDDRNTFMSQGYRGYVRDVCNTNIGLFKDKMKFNEFFSELIRRDWMKVTPKNFDEFKKFVEKHTKFFSKPLKGGGGIGAKILSSEEETVEELYNYCCEHECIVEELVQQHPKMNEVYDGAINTIRVLTLMDENNTPLILGAVSKFGRDGLITDNHASGGIAGHIIDLNTGIIQTSGEDKTGRRHYKHPNSGVELVGFQIPEWEKVKETAKKGAIIASKYNRHVGWDIAIRSDGEIEIIEGNSWPDLSLLQLGDCTGRLYLYEKPIKTLAKRMNMPDYPKIPDNVINVSTPEAKAEVYSKMREYGVKE